MKNILIFKHGLLGDVIVAIPAIYLLRRQYPDTRLILFLEKLPNDAHLISKNLLLKTGLVDEVAEFTTSTFRELLRLARNVRRLSKQALFALNLERFGWSRKREFFCSFLGIHKVFGPSCLNRVSLGATDNIAHQLYGIAFQSCFEMVKAINTKNIDYPKLTIGAASNTYLKWSSKNSVVAQFSGIVLLGIWSNMDSKRWPVDRFVDIANHLTETHNLLPVCIGGGHEDEVRAAKYITENSHALSVVGQMSICESYEFFKQAKVYIGNDTGAMHLAALAGLPCISIFSAREASDLWHPIGSDFHQVLKTSPPCSGCQLRVCKFPLDRCVDQITVENVTSAVDRVFSARRGQ